MIDEYWEKIREPLEVRQQPPGTRQLFSSLKATRVVARKLSKFSSVCMVALLWKVSQGISRPC